MSWPEGGPGGNTGNLHFDEATRRWYRFNPQTYTSQDLDPQPPAPRSSAALVGQADNTYADASTSNLVGDFRRMDLASSYSHSLDETSGRPAQEEDWTLVSDPLSRPEVIENAAVPRVRFGPSDMVTDPALAAEGGTALARVSASDHRRTSQTLDLDFVVRKNPKRFFVPGRVMKVLWPEVTGRGDDKIDAELTEFLFQDSRRTRRIRWFVVVMSGHDACTCLPISTYGRQGVAKSGVRKWEHSIVYTDRAPPQPMYGEAPGANEQPMRTPIRVKPTRDGDYMESESRLNYGKMYTIDHNVRVYDFGMVRQEFLPILTTQWREILDRYSSASAASATSATSGEQDFQRPKTPELPSTSPAQYIDYGYATESYAPPQSEDRQISIEQDDKLAIIDWPYPEWARAYNQTSGETGLVPINRIKLYESGKALYTWSSDGRHGYVAITKGDDLKLLDLPHAGWAKVWNQRTAETGLCPENYFERISSRRK